MCYYPYILGFGSDISSSNLFWCPRVCLCVRTCAMSACHMWGEQNTCTGQPGPLIAHTTRIIKHIRKEKTSEITHIQDLIYRFANCKSIVITSDPHFAVGECELLA